MKYLKVKWSHASGEEEEPTLLYSELDDSGMEIRKVEIFQDGRTQYAEEHNNIGDTRLSLEPLPVLQEINSQGSFVGDEITQAEFEEVWKKAHNEAS